jgi:hypothetical protein
MSKASQRKLAEQQKRTKEKSMRNESIAVPVGGIGIAFQRHCGDVQEQNGLADNKHYQAAKAAWLAGSTDFFLYVMRRDGRSTVFEFSDADGLNIYVDRLLAEFEARKVACALQIHCEAGLAGLTEKVERHIVEVGSQNHKDTEKITGIEVKKISNPSFGKLLVVMVSRDLVENQTVYGLLRVLDSFVISAQAVEDNFMNLRLSFSGYDDDKREIFEVPEIRRFMQLVTQHAPWWMALAAPSDYIVWCGSLAQLDFVKHGKGNELEIKFMPQAIAKVLADAVPEISTLLRCADFKDEFTKKTMIENVSLAIAQMMAGVNQSALDPFAQKVYAATSKHG